MRTPTSTLSLLLFLRLASTLPTSESDSKNSRHPADCHHESCFLSPINQKHTPPPSTPLSPPSDPHFPSHQLSPSTPTSNTKLAPLEIEIEIDNTPKTPTSATSKSEALGAAHPLTSNYLLSLSNSNPASKPGIQKPPIPTEIQWQAKPNTFSKTQPSNDEEETAPLPAKPSSALAELRKEELERYWATVTASNEQLDKLEGSVKAAEVGCGGRRAYYRVQSMPLSSGGYSDLIVVGIVVMFLAAVIVLEGLDKIREMRSLRADRNTKSGRKGAIYLQDDETLAFVVKKPYPYLLEAAAPPSYHIDSGMDFDLNEKAGYDSDAEETV